MAGFPLGSYALMVDYTQRLFREGKAAMSRELAAICDRLGTTAESWWSRLAKLSQGRLFGASSRRPATACRMLPTDWACAASSLWDDARHVETSGRLKLDGIGDRRPDSYPSNRA